MDGHDFDEFMRPDLPTMGLTKIVFTIAPGFSRFCESAGRHFGMLAMPVQYALLLAFYCFLVPLQILLICFVLIPVRILAGKGNLGDNITKWLIAASPMIAYAVYFGPRELWRLIAPFLGLN